MIREECYAGCFNLIKEKVKVAYKKPVKTFLINFFYGWGSERLRLFLLGENRRSFSSPTYFSIKTAEPSKQESETKTLIMRGKVETVVLSERMLAALVSGVKGGKWFSLWDKVWRRGTLERAWELVSKNKGAGGVDGVSRCNYHQQDLTRLMTKSFQHQSILASLSSGFD